MTRSQKRPTGAILLAVVAFVVATTGSATAAALITSSQIKDGTIQLRDLNAKTRAAWYTKQQSDTRYYTKTQVRERSRFLQSTRAEPATVTDTSTLVVTAGGSAPYSGNYTGPIQVPAATAPDYVYWAFDVHAVVQLDVTGSTTCRINRVADGVSTPGTAVTTTASGPLQLSDSFFTFAPGTFWFDVTCSGNATVPTNGARIAVIAGSIT
ncbi:MAG TPA: hypothetical protein PLP61_05290 [Nocardioides sp.]|uniref:hypothetical protein n=1 Tax=Nocardioides sp. TaxID=35761 RepID=UPI002CF76918|nr:hypothetical protein [Nocardioides sp.]HQR26436.1 hypothetical protein [Nocardioides sp.]